MTGIIREPPRHRRDTGALIATRYKDASTIWTITTGRSGTRTLARIASQFAGIAAAHEPFPELTYPGRLAIEGNWEADPVTMHLARGRLVEGAYTRQQHYLECALNLSHLADDISRAFVGARFIHLHRDPREFVRSALSKHWFAGASTQDHYFPRLGEGPPAILAIRYWAAVHREGLRLERDLGESLVHRIASEDLWTDPEAWERMLHWIGGEKDVPRDLCSRTRGITWSVLLGRRNTTPNPKPDWEWEEDLQAIAGDVLDELRP